jgi:hypothetical protein
MLRDQCFRTHVGGRGLSEQLLLQQQHQWLYTAEQAMHGEAAGNHHAVPTCC